MTTGGTGLGASDAFAREQLTDAQLDWLAALPATAPPGATPAGLLLCHRVPGDDEGYLLEQVTPAGLRNRGPAAVRELLGDRLSAQLVLCGHTHLQRLLPRGYPWQEAVAAARAQGREDWAVPLATGLALPTLTS